MLMELDRACEEPTAESATMKRAELSGTQCIQRAFAVVRLLAGGSPQGEKLVDIATRLNLSHPTAHRLLRALESEGVVERVPGSRRYLIGSEAAWLGLAAYSRFPITRCAAATLDRLVVDIGDSVFLAVPSHNDSIYADRRFGPYPVQARRVSIGSRRPLGVSVAGRAMLGFMNAPRVESVLRGNEPRYRQWNCPVETVLKGVEQARAQGYLCAESLVNKERRALAVPVRDVVGQPVAAISVIAAHGRLGPERISRLLPLMKQAAREVSEVLRQQQLQPIGG
jgi:DNA-binding IclR family transcriptional regulator